MSTFNPCKPDPAAPSCGGTTSEHKDLKYFYEQTVVQINREETLINWRVTAMIAINGFLFASLALGADKSEHPHYMRRMIIEVVPWAGIVVSFLGFMAICAANMAICQLKKDIRSKITCIDAGTCFPRAYGANWAYWLGFLPAQLTPVLLAIAWICMMSFLPNC